MTALPIQPFRRLASHCEKVEWLERLLGHCSFSESEQERPPPSFVVMIGEGNTGKSTALNEALQRFLDQDDELKRTIVIWNFGEIPQIATGRGTRPSLAPDFPLVIVNYIGRTTDMELTDLLNVLRRGSSDSGMVVAEFLQDGQQEQHLT